MKQKLFIFVALIFLLTILIGLNAASYVQKEKIPDSEQMPNRSTYNTGATGTRAFYDLLAETGRDVIRWQEPFPTNGVFSTEKISTFVIIGKTRRKIKDKEITAILDWVSAGGTLVIIDRNPPEELLSTTASWSIYQNFSDDSNFTVDPSNQNQMVGDAEAVKPTFPSIFTSNVNAVQPSKFASSIKVARLLDSKNEEEKDGVGEAPEIVQTAPANTSSSPPPPKENSEDEIGNVKTENDELFATPTPTPIKPVITPTPVVEVKKDTDTALLAPVIHLANDKQNLLVDFPFEAGRIIYLSDPYIVSNNGISLVDNAQIGINIVDSRIGKIAFDEYHQGYGNNENRLLAYFEGTPLVAIFLQIFLLIGLIFYSQSRRFARALPADDPNRLSKLEYVSAMAQIQQRTKAYDLALENIYGDFRRRVSRLVGVDNKTTSREDLAAKIAERTKHKVKELEDLLYKCEDIMHGEPTSKKTIVDLTSRLRKIEEDLGLRRGKKRE